MFEFFAALAAVFSAAGAVESSKAARSQRRAQQAQREQQNMRAAMERRQSIRQSRIAYAQALQNAENQGVADGSSIGGRYSIATQGNVNLSFINNQMDAANMAGRWLDKASKQESAARMWGSLAEMSSFAMGQFEQPDWLKALSGNAPPRNAQIPKPGRSSGLKGPWGP